MLPYFVTVAVMWIPWVLLIDLDTTELVTGRSRLAASSVEPQRTCRRDHPALAPSVIILTENRECLNARISARPYVRAAAAGYKP